MKVLLRVYSTYGLIVFAGVFLLLLPLFLLLMLKRSWHPYALLLNQFWARAFLMLMFIPAKVEWRTRLKKKQPCVFVANHFSLLDIVVMGYMPKPFVFVGKAVLAKIPLFGYMFRKLHITVDRENYRSRYNALLESYRAVEEGKSVVMFPEGGIRSETPPKMASFKNGPFKLAIEKQIPIVPVTLPFNWKILPDDGKLLMRPKRPKVIMHEPIMTAGMHCEDIDFLKEQTFQVLDKELSIYFPHIQHKTSKAYES